MRGGRWKTYSNGSTTSLPTSILFTKGRLFLFSENVDFEGGKFMSMLVILILLSTTIVKTLPPYWETWYAQKGFRHLIIILSILIATFVHFFNVLFLLSFILARMHRKNGQFASLKESPGSSNWDSAQSSGQVGTSHSETWPCVISNLDLILL